MFRFMFAPVNKAKGERSGNFFCLKLWKLQTHCSDMCYEMFVETQSIYCISSWRSTPTWKSFKIRCRKYIFKERNIFKNLSVKNYLTWLKVFKNGPSIICRRQPLKNLKGYGLLRQFPDFLKAVFHKFCLVHSLP